MNKILITGSTGFVGSILKSRLLNDGFDIKDIQEFSQTKIDISKQFDIDYSYLADTVIHIAGKAHSVPKNIEDEREFYDVNFQGTINLCSTIDKLKEKPAAFIFVSTVSVYGLEKGEKISEDYPLIGSSPYAQSKILAEEFLKEWAKENDIVLGILRLPLLVGPNPPGNLEKMISGIKSGRYLSIGEAKSRKSMLWAEDIAALIPVIIKKGGIYNLTDGYHPSFSELEDLISLSMNKPRPKRISLFIAKLLASFGDLFGNIAPINSSKLKKITSTLTFDDSKARNLLGWKPSKVLDRLKEHHF